MNPASSTTSHLVIACSKVADIVVLCLLVIFFVGFLAFDYELLGFHDPFLKIPHEGKQYFETIPWIIFGVLVFDLYLKYIIAGKKLKLFFKHYWLDVSMAALIPILLPLKFGYKLGHKVNKFLTVMKGKRIK